MPRYGVTSMTAPLRRVLVRRPALARRLGGRRVARRPTRRCSTRQHEAFVELLDRLGPEVEVADGARRPGRLRLHARPGAGHGPRRDPAADGQAGAAGRARGDGRASSSGSACPCSARWRSPRTPTAATASGSTTRRWRSGSATGPTSPASRRCARLVEPEGVAVEAYDMPHDQGPGFVLHLQSFLSGGQRATSAWSTSRSPRSGCCRTCGPAASTGSRSPTTTTSRWGATCSPSGPGVVVMVDGVPAVRRALEARGVEVHVYDGSELSLKGDGGPTCLTAPLLRDDGLMPVYGYKASAEQFGPVRAARLQREGRGVRGWRSSRCRTTSSRGATTAGTRRRRCRGSAPRASGRAPRGSGRACSRRRSATSPAVIAQAFATLGCLRPAASSSASGPARR